MARDLHDFLNIAWQTVDVRKAHKMVMKIEICITRPTKRISKSFAYLIMKKIWIEKIAKLLSHSIYMQHTFEFNMLVIIVRNDDLLQ